MYIVRVLPALSHNPVNPHETPQFNSFLGDSRHRGGVPLCSLVIAVSQHPDRGWAQVDVDALLQTKWEGCYHDETIYHVATPAFYEIEGKWYLYAQACPLPANGNYIDGHWDMWCFSCDREIPTLPGHTKIFVPGNAQ